MKLSEVANKVINLAGKIREYYATELPKRHPNYPLVDPFEASMPPPPEEKVLRSFLATLSEDMIYQLILIMYLGRGDFGTEDLAENHETLRGTFGGPEHAVSQMMGKAPLADYLSDGLEALRQHKINPDKLPLKKVVLRKR
ncbi:MAG TPA: DUF3775 domain-containing protein [Pirellulales bacterium]|nr:DUF3775 domain-containing protein [Pirellulales bacterium]